MKNISIDSVLHANCSEIQLSCISCDIEIEEKSTSLWKLIEQQCKELASKLKTEDIRYIPAIASARKAYRACGKDPARYRLSAEALLRRVVNGKGLYSINNVVDLLNLVSINTGFSIGGYDADQIIGDICMGIGEAAEPYRGLGRGDLNIENMPVFRDEKGAFGTFTSDSVRTGVSDQTTHFLMVIVSYCGDYELNEATRMAIQLLTDYSKGKQFKTKTICF